MRNVLFIILFPLLFSCQKYNKSPYDNKEEILRNFPIETTKSMVLDSFWQERDSLTYLRLKNTEIIMITETSTIPTWIGNFQKMKIFKVVNEKRKIKLIPESIGNLTNLLEFDIPDNEVSSLPISFRNLKKLKNINLSNNPIISIDNKLNNSPNIESINLDKTLIDNLPDEICKLNKIKFLTLMDTEIKHLPKCLGNMSNLDWINVSETKLKEFPIEILNAPKLETVHAKGLKLDNYKEVKSVCEARNINFYYNE